MTLRRLGLAAVLVLLIAGATLFYARREIAHALLVERARALGLAELGFDVIEMEVDHARLANLQVDFSSPEISLTVREAELHYSPGSLLLERLLRVNLTGVELHAAIGDQALAAMVSGESSGSLLDLYPFDSLNLESVLLLLQSENNGEVRVLADLHSALAADAIGFDLDLELQIERPEILARTRAVGKLFEDSVFEVALVPLRLGGRTGEAPDAPGFELELPRLEVRQGGRDTQGLPLQSTPLHVSAKAGKLAIPSEFVELQELSFDLSFGAQEQVPHGVFAVGRIEDLATPKRFGPMTLRGNIAPEPAGRLRVDFDLEDIDRLLQMRVEATHALETGRGELKFVLAKLSLDQVESRLPALAPGVELEISDLSGELGLAGASHWRDDDLEVEFTLHLRDLALTTEYGRITGVNAAVSMRGPTPFYMPDVQQMTIERFAAGVELSNAIIDFRLRRDGAVEVPRLQWDFAGGVASTQGLYDPESSRQAFTVVATGVNLRAFIALLDIDGLTGEGALAGEFPVYLDQGAIELRDAKLTTTGEGGWLRYRPGGVASAIAAGDKHLHQLAEILENFHFESIVISLNGNVLGDVEATIQLKGANPDYYDGLPVELNTNIESQFGDLIRGGTAAFSFATQIAEALERSSRRRAQPEPETP
jgi:hypothetical protein